VRINSSARVTDPRNMKHPDLRHPPRLVRRLALTALVVLAAGCSQYGDDDAEPTATTEKVFVIATVTPQQSPTPRTTGVEYVVQEGDTISGIAEMFGVSQDEIARANNLTNLDTIHAGQVLQIPPPDTATPAS
jgi:LysM repeat protein